MSTPIATICNVNDGDAARYVITRMLTHAGFTVVEATNGQEALACARERRPAAMILDLKLPDIDGVEVCRRLKADPETASIAVLQTSATFVSLADKVHGLEHGADAFLAQPFGAQELVATVRSLLRLQERETAQLRRAEALAEADRRKDEFLAMLAHELRNPLAAVTTAHAVLASYPARDPTEARAREIASRQAAQLGRIVDDLLDVSRVMRGVTSLQRERVDIAALLAQATRLVADTRLVSDDRRLTSPDESPIYVDGDPTRLLQIFSNLLDNAVKYTGPGDAIAVSIHVDAGEAVIRIRDEGVGIDPAAQASVFDLFWQADTPSHRAGGGLGIGLTLVKTLVELHGGRVDLRSDGPGRGTTVELRLAALAEQGPPRPRPAPHRSTSPLRVLLVEDNDDARDALADLLGLWGHAVLCARDGPAGVATALAERPDVALIDLGLPGIDGHEVARRIHADPRGVDITLIALSGYGSAEQRAASSAASYAAHLVKPADPAHLAILLSAIRPRT